MHLVSSRPTRGAGERGNLALGDLHDHGPDGVIGLGGAAWPTRRSRGRSQVGGTRGRGALGPEIIEASVSRAGGPDSPIVLIPTAAEKDPVDVPGRGDAFAKEFGVTHVTVLHTRDRAEADTEAFVAPLKTARGVWFGGGRQWRLVDAYRGTRTQRELEAVLAPGGGVGGASGRGTHPGSSPRPGGRA